MSPRRFGEPASRDRWYRILFNTDVLRWNCAYNMEELTDILLLPMRGELRCDVSIYMWSDRLVKAPRGPEVLASGGAKSLRNYKQMFPEKEIYDLSQNPKYMPKTETAEGALCTLCTSSKLWWRRRDRFMTARELLGTLGYPAHPPSANTLGTDTWIQIFF